ncbi:hypothetical protein C0J52_17621 [Blattella germanica]|nr:hypothetical protein C0J52_17621 [Blattella germanica]
MKFCQKLGDTQADTILKMQQVFGDNSMSISRIKSGSIVPKMAAQIANEVGISIGSVYAILTKDLGLRRVSAKLVPKLLTMEQKQWRADNTQDMMDTAKSDPNFLKTVITGDETYGWFMDTTQKRKFSRHKGNIRHPQGEKIKTSPQQCQGNIECFL